MKTLLTILCSTSLLYSEVIEEQIPELIQFDQNLIQQPLTLEAMQFPEPALELSRQKSSFLAVSLSTLMPGLGNAYLGDFKTASGFFGTVSSTIGVAALSESNETIQLNNLITAQNVWSYGIYAAYRDVRIYNGQLGYSYKMPSDSLSDLTTAPFRFSVMKKPEVWGGILGALACGIGMGSLMHNKARIPIKLSSEMSISPFVALPVGIGEEAFFRGFLQSQLSEVLTPWGGIAVSSLAFGAVHIPNAMALEPEDRWRYYAFGLPLITGIGVYCGWLTQKNHSLKESVALHTWYDFVVFSAGTLASGAAITGRYEFAFSTPF